MSHGVGADATAGIRSTDAVEGGIPGEDEPRAAPSSRARWPSALCLSAVGGGCLWLAFPPHGLWPLAVVGPLALTAVTHGRTSRAGALLGFVLGLAFMTPLLSWTGVFVGDLPWLALSVLQAGFFAVLGAVSAALGGRRGWPLWIAASWVAVEAARSRIPFGGFPWGRVGFSQPEGPLASLAAYGGVALVSFAVALTGTCGAAWLLRERLWRRDRTWGSLRGRLGLVVAAVLPAGLGALAWLPLPGASLTAGGPTAMLAVIQGDVPRAGLDFNAQRRAVLDNHVQRTLELAARVAAGEAPQPDAVIWPENSSDIDPLRNADAAEAIDRAARAIGAPVLVGAVLEGPGERLTNAGIVWDPVTGPGESYAKRQLVPFGEYMPARSFFRLFSDKVDLLEREFAPGRASGVLEVGGVRVGDVICFEVAFDGLVSEVVDGGATVIVVQTNNATFGYTAESEQQLAMSRLRAIEHGRSVVVAATSGISAVIAPDGTVVERSELFTPWVFTGPVAQRQQSTVASRLGAAPEWALTAISIGALATALRRPRPRPRSATPGVAGSPSTPERCAP